jgi:hypothetical protein
VDGKPVGRKSDSTEVGEGAAKIIGEIIAITDANIEAGNPPDYLGAWLAACLGKSPVNLPDDKRGLVFRGEGADTGLGGGQDGLGIIGGEFVGLNEVVDQGERNSSPSDGNVVSRAHGSS